MIIKSEDSIDNKKKNIIEDTLDNLQKTRKNLEETIKNLNASSRNLHNSLNNLKSINQFNGDTYSIFSFKTIPTIEEAAKQIENQFEYLLIESDSLDEILFFKKSNF